jgi:hypothetical protein
MDQARDSSNTSRIFIGMAMLFVIGIAIGALLFDGSTEKTPVATTVVEQSASYPDIHQCDYLVDTALTATSVFNGRLDESDFDGTNGDGSNSDQLPANLGYPTGAAGMNQWLIDVNRIMVSKGADGDVWSPSDNVIVKNHRADSAQGFTFLSPDKVVGFDYDGNANDDIDWTTRQVLGLVLNDIIEANPQNPAQLFAALPKGC